MAGKEWTDEEVQAEISAAVKIVHEDRITKLLNSKLGGKPNDPPSGNPPGNPPPGTDPPGDGKKKRSIFWGEHANS